MVPPLKAMEIRDGVFWVGAIDPNVRDFHGYLTGRGTTYNAYLVLGEKVTLIDTVKRPFMDEMMGRIASVIPPADIDCIVSCHAEMDHSGSLPDVIRAVVPEKVFASKMGVAALQAHFRGLPTLTPLEDGGRLEIGGEGSPNGRLTLQAMETRFLHWPDSMFCYLPERRLLFSQDAFGMHLAGTQRYDDQLPAWLLEYEAAKYYANILLPYSGLVSKLLDKVAASGLAFEVVAPSHGPIWRSAIADVLGWYRAWAAQELKQNAVVLYDTMWGSTDLMARTICDGLASAGADSVQLCLSASHRSDAAAEVLRAGALIVGSPTLNNQVFPTVADAMSYLKGLRPKGRPCATFGSYGWSGESMKQLVDMLAAMGFEDMGQVKAKYVPDENVLKECWDLGRRMGQRLVGGQ